MAGQSVPGPMCVTRSPPLDRGTMCLATSRPSGPVCKFPAIDVEPPAEEDGIRIVLTPLQLAAVLESGTLEPPSLGTRVWGGVAVIGGALELAGAAALLLTPEPTMVTKVAGGALGIHGTDTAQAGVRQAFSGQSTSTFMSEGATAAALELGVDEKNARLIGLTADIAIPLIAGGVGAMRVLAIRRGAISLSTEDAAGGHTILTHVGRTEAELLERLNTSTRIRAASTFRTLGEAERVVAQALRAEQAALKAWAQTAAAGERMRITYDAGRSVGFGILKKTTAVAQMNRVRVVVQKVQAADRVFFVLTAFPVP